MMFGKEKKNTLNVIGVDLECVQCWKKFGKVYVTPGTTEDSYLNMAHMCPTCFNKLAKRANDNDRRKK